MAGKKLAAERATTPGHKERRAGRARRRALRAPARAPPDSPWTDLEQFFFDGAPPEEPQAALPVERFDDLAEPPTSGQKEMEGIAALGRALADAGAVLWCLLFGHSRRGGSRRTPYR